MSVYKNITFLYKILSLNEMYKSLKNSVFEHGENTFNSILQLNMKNKTIYVSEEIHDIIQ